MIRLAGELGISDVGLAKVCKRHTIPVPPRGYWARVAAGQNPMKSALPAPERNPDIPLNTSTPAEIEQRRKSAAKQTQGRQVTADKVKALPQFNFPLSLVDPVPLVKKTATYCERLPSIIAKWEKRWGTASSLPDSDYPPEERNGRYGLCGKGLLDITASLTRIDWILRFHDAVLKTVILAGLRVAWLERDKTKAARVEIRKGAESVTISFSEGYSRTKLDPKELAKRKAVKSWASEWEYPVADRVTFRVIGTEHEARQEWTGSREKMEGQFLEIAQTIVDFIANQPEFRRLRELREAEARRQANIAAENRFKSQARSDQLEHAFKIAEAYDRRESLIRYLNTLEARVPSMTEPYGERAVVWLQVVRSELANSDPVDHFLSESLNPQSWRGWPPPWWPDEANGGGSEDALRE